MSRRAALLLACALSAPVTVAAASLGSLPLDYPAGIAVDSERRQAFVSGAREVDEAIAVTDLDGNPVARILTGGRSDDLVLDTTHGVLHASLPETGEVLQIDLDTRLVLRRTAVTPAPCLSMALAVVGGRLWALGGCEGVLHGYDLDRLGLPGARTSLPTTAGEADLAGAEHGRYLVVRHGPYEQAVVEVLDVSSPVPATVATAGEAELGGTVVAGTAVPATDDVVYAVVGRPWRVRAYELPGLRPRETYAEADVGHPQGLTVSPDGSRLALTELGWYTTNLAVYAVGEPTPVAYGDWHGTYTPAAWDGDDRLLVPAEDTTGGGWRVRVVGGLDALPARLSLRPGTLAGRLRLLDGTPAGGRVVRVWRSVAGRPTTELAPAVTDASGGFAIADTPPHPGSWRYRARWDGDARHAPVVATATREVAGQRPPVAAPPPPLLDEVKLELPTPGFTEMVADPSFHRLYVTGGRQLTVLDADGGNPRTVPGVELAYGLALSPDATTMYVGSGAGAVHAIDLSTVEVVATWTTWPWAPSVDFLGEVGGRVFFGYSERHTTGGGWGVLDPADPAAVRVFPGDRLSDPMFAAAPGPSLVAAEDGVTPGSLSRYDVSGPDPVRREYLRDVGGNVQDIEATPDGRHVLVAAGAPYYVQLRDATTLGEARRYDNGHYPTAVAVTRDGGFHAAGVANWYPEGPTVTVHDALTGVQVNGFTSTLQAGRGLAFDAAGTRLYLAEAYAPYAEYAHLRVIPYPTVPRRCLVVDPFPATTPAGSPFVLAGESRRVDGSPATGDRVELRRGTDVPVAAATVDAAGRWRLSYTPPATGEATFEVRAGGCARAITVSVVGRPTTLTVGTVYARTRTPSVPVTLTGHAGTAQVTVYRVAGGRRTVVSSIALVSGRTAWVPVAAPATVEAVFRGTGVSQPARGAGAVHLPRRTVREWNRLR